MKLLDDQAVARSWAVCCDVAADAVVRVSLESLGELRRNPGPVNREPLPASFLKHADEQTVAGLSAVYQAIAQARLHETCFRDWGVVAAPRFLGRPTMAAALQRFLAEGAWGVSPHLIPHRSLHSISGTVSQALKIHGPNFGVGGGPEAAVEVLLAATALREGKHLPGVWVVLTCLDPESPPDEAGRMAPGTQVVGVALALTPISPPALSMVGGVGGERLRLRVVCGTRDAEASARGKRSIGGSAAAFDLGRLEKMLQLLHGARGGEMTVVHLLDSRRRLEFSRVPAANAAALAGSPRQQGQPFIMVPG